MWSAPLGSRAAVETVSPQPRSDLHAYSLVLVGHVVGQLLATNKPHQPLQLHLEDTPIEPRDSDQTLDRVVRVKVEEVADKQRLLGLWDRRVLLFFLIICHVEVMGR